MRAYSKNDEQPLGLQRDNKNHMRAARGVQGNYESRMDHLEFEGKAYREGKGQDKRVVF